MHRVLGRFDAFPLTTGDLDSLLLDAADRFSARPSEEQVAGLTARTGASPLFV